MAITNPLGDNSSKIKTFPRMFVAPTNIRSPAKGKKSELKSDQQSIISTTSIKKKYKNTKENHILARNWKKIHDNELRINFRKMLFVSKSRKR